MVGPMPTPTPLDRAAEQRVRDLIATVDDFPQPGIRFRDITPLLADPQALDRVVEGLAALIGEPVTAVAGVESRGFIFGALLAARLGCGFVPVRKPGKLPRTVIARDYELEYGPPGRLELHADAVGPADIVVVVDDLLATGGTAEAAVGLIAHTGARVTGALFVIELDDLGGRDRLGRASIPVSSLIHY